MATKKEAATETANNTDRKSTNNSEITYLEQRLTALGITDEINQVKGILHYPQWRTFTDDGKGNIEINYLSPYRQPYTYMEGNKEKEFSRIRLAKPGNGAKYIQPRGTETFPFFTPVMLEKFRAKEKIPTLYIVEGEFKAFKLAMYGVPCIGIGGIQNFKDSKKDKLHQDIIEVLTVCQVENVVLLFDRDCLEIKWEEGKDLALRPNGFYTALNTFNELLKPYDKQLYFSHVSRECKEKGIDDLLCSLKENKDVEKCLAELQSFLEGAKNRKYIDTCLITGISSYNIQSVFGLTNVQAFYDLYKKQLEDRDFVYRGKPYHIENGKPVLSWGGIENSYILVGNDYYQKVVDKSAHGDDEINLYKRDKGIITGRYGKKFINFIQIYDNFANIPENDPDKYRQRIVSEKDGVKSVLYNIYRPLDWRPVEGEWLTIEKFLHHLFDYKNTQGKPLFELFLDWIQIVYTNPTQQLPCICLVSKERETGKTTFLDLMHLIFSENFRVLDSERIGNRFNESWAGKLVIGVDESLIDPENKGTVANTLKTLITNKTINSEGKGTANKPIANYAKLVMCSNDETNFIKIESEENRYMVVKVPTLQEKDPDLLNKMKSEIPAFLFFLKNRKLHHERKDRLWFDPVEFETEALLRIQECTENLLARNVKECIRQQFFIQKTVTVRLSLAVIYTMVKEQYKHADKIRIKDYLNGRGYTTKNPSSFTYYWSFEDKDRGGTTTKDKYYELRVEDWLTNDEIKNYEIE